MSILSESRTDLIVAGRSAFLDAARGVAALGVFVYHLFALNIVPRPPGALYPVPEIGSFGVDLFYVLSGYFITTAILRPAQWQPAQFWWARVTRIYPAYLVSMAVLLIGKLAFTQFAIDGYQISVILLHLVMLHNVIPGIGGAINGVYWTLGVEFPYYFVMLAIAPFLRVRRGFVITSLILLAISLIWRLSVYMFLSDKGDADLLWFADSQMLGSLDMFALGGLAAFLQIGGLLKIGYQKYYSYIFLFAVASLVTVMRYFVKHAGDYWFYWPTAILFRTALAANFAVIIFLLASMKPNRWLAFSSLPWFGKISFSFYLYHFPCINLVEAVIPTAPWPAKIIVIAVLTTLVSWASWRFVEIRFHNFTRKPRGATAPSPA